MLQTVSEPARADGRRLVPSLAKKRSLLVKLHLWVGLSLGVLLVLIGISGSVMVFRYELERIFFPSLTHSTASGSADLDACLAAAQAIDPHKSVRTLHLPVNSDGTQEWLTIPIGQTTKDEATTVYTDPHSCAVLGTRGPRKDGMSFLVNFHHALLLGKKGAYLQTAVAIAAIFLAVSGLIQWWPKRWAWSRLQPRASARPLHYALGFWAMWPLLLIATSAIYMAWRLEINKVLLGETNPKNSAPARPKAKVAKSDNASKAKRPGTAFSLDAVMNAANAAKPNATWRILTLPQKPNEPFTISYQLPGEYGRTGNNQISLKSNLDGTARVTAVSELHLSSAMNRFLTELVQIHYGEFGGIATRLVWCVVGFIPAVLFSGGLLIWQRRLQMEAASAALIAARASNKARLST